ncbi:unnamed protein product [Parnassius mnemosyne]|uniref:C2H2-type domain-containing protein n=1 Tax=Parnassius mnemosyne TaxID=213953 RepID=A0AAV1K6Y9_9NEOP
MRNVDSHLLEDKMDEAVTHYINSHHSTEPVHVDANSLSLNVQDDNGGRVVTVMHPLSFSATQMCRQVSVNEQVGEGQWNEELLDPEGRLAALVAHLAQHSRPSHHLPTHHKVPAVRNEVDASVILDTPMKLYNGQHLDHQSEPIVVQLPSHFAPLPPLQDMKRCQETDWFNNKTKPTLKDNNPMLAEADGPVLDIGASASPVQNKQSKKSLPHKKRISRKLKRNAGNSTPQQDIVVIHCNSEVPQEEILPDNFVNGVPHSEHIPGDGHHITQEMRPIFICQLCGEFYGEEQLKFYQHLKQHYEPHGKFYQHLKQHYEPHGTIIIENTVPDLGIDKMTNTCIVDNVPTLPDSLVELSLENTVPKSMYQPMDKHILYTSSDKTLTCPSNKVQYTMASEKELPQDNVKADLYETLAKLELYSCTRCDKTFRKQKQCEAHIKEEHSNAKLEDMGEFSEPEDLMEGIHVAVEDGEQYEPTILPHLIVENGHVHQEHVRNWYTRNGGNAGTMCECGAPDYCPVCPNTEPAPVSAPSHIPAPAPAHIPVSAPTHIPASVSGHLPAPVPTSGPPPLPPVSSAAVLSRHTHSPSHLKEEVLHTIFEDEVHNQDNPNYNEGVISDNLEGIPPPEPPHEEEQKAQVDPGEKKKKKFDCPLCDRVFFHRNSLLYHMLMHGEKQHICKDCNKSFYTANSLKVHRRVHSDDRPCACDECGRSFRQWSDLKYHKASIHSDQKHFKCEFCNKEFARRYSLNVHRRIHTGERNYKCEYCTKTFRASSYRLIHMRTHTGNKPYKCQQCEKCFRVAYDLRRHMLIHDKVRLRVDGVKAKPKDTKEKKSQGKVKNDAKEEPKQNDQEETNLKSTKKNAILKSILDKKQPQKMTKKTQNPKKGAPNITIASNRDGQFKINNEFTNNVEVFDTRQIEYNKYKEEYVTNEYRRDEMLHTYKKEDYQDDNSYKESQRLAVERDLAVLRPILRSSPQMEDLQKPVLRGENTDGKLQVFTQVEKSKDVSGYNTPLSSSHPNISLNDMKHLERDINREVRNDLSGENMDNVFLERLSAFYNITAV